MTVTVLRGATVVDATGSEPFTADIAIEHGRIVGIGTVAGGGGVDCTGMTITPGLIDAHVHFGQSSDIGASVRHDISVAELAADIFNNLSSTLDGGFTTVRDVGGIDDGVAGVVAKGKVRGPRVLQCGPILCQTGGHGHLGADWEPTAAWTSHAIPGLRQLSMLADGPDEMRKNVRETFRRGADFIKMCVTGGVVSTHDDISDTQFTVAEIAVAVEEASARGTYVTVHAHNNDGIRNAVLAGARCVEHGSQIDQATAELMAKHGVAHVPTLAVIEALLTDASAAGLPSDTAGRVGAVRDGQRAAIKASRAAGVTLGLGSDLIGPHQQDRGRELVLRADVETPMLALISATKTNSEILRISNDVGTVEVGKIADLVAWTSNPIEHPEVFADREQIALVLQSGEVVRGCDVTSSQSRSSRPLVPRLRPPRGTASKWPDQQPRHDPDRVRRRQD